MSLDLGCFGKSSKSCGKSGKGAGRGKGGKGSGTCFPISFFTHLVCALLSIRTILIHLSHPKIYVYLILVQEVEMDTATVVQDLEVESPARAVVDQAVDLPRVARAVADTDQVVDQAVPRAARAPRMDTDQAVDLPRVARAPRMDMDTVAVDQEVASPASQVEEDPSQARVEVPNHPRASTDIQVDTNTTTDQFVILRLMNKKSKMHHPQDKRATCVGERRRSRYISLTPSIL